jgi:hypothetical protein
MITRTEPPLPLMTLEQRSEEKGGGRLAGNMNWNRRLFVPKRAVLAFFSDSVPLYFDNILLTDSTPTLIVLLHRREEIVRREQLN